MQRRGGIWGMVAVACALVGGCAIETPPSSRRAWVEAAPIDPETWPERRPGCLTAYLAANEILPWPEHLAPPAPAGPSDIEGLREEVHRASCLRRLTLCGGDYVNRGQSGEGIVLESIHNDDGGERDRFVVLLNRLDRDALVQTLETPRPQRAGSEGIDRFRFILRRATDRPSRGLIVHLVSIGDLRYEDAVVNALRRDGWDTLTCIPRGFTVGFVNADETGLVSPYEVANEIDGYLASQACAIESMLGYLARDRGDAEPLVMVGFSLGALATPTVAARLGDRVSAVVMVGGGTNVARIVLEGDLTRELGDSAVRRLGYGVRSELNAIPDRYLTMSRFDPYRTAPHLSGRPVLLLHAAFDRIVPASTGDELYRRSGRPERWTYPLGHLGLFWWLPTQASRITAWVDDAVD